MTLETRHKQLDRLTKAKLIELVEAIHDTLYLSDNNLHEPYLDPDKVWDSELLGDLAYLLNVWQLEPTAEGDEPGEECDG
jgi:hypothetical protein